MALHGSDLGAELGTLEFAGKVLLPQVADDYHAAWVSTPVSVSGITRRGSAIGIDPGKFFDDVLDSCNQAMLDTEKALRGVGDALVRTAQDFAASDADAKAAMNAKFTALKQEHH